MINCLCLITGKGRDSLPFAVIRACQVSKIFLETEKKSLTASATDASEPSHESYDGIFDDLFDDADWGLPGDGVLKNFLRLE
jgi:hypothetical protein